MQLDPKPGPVKETIVGVSVQCIFQSGLRTILVHDKEHLPDLSKSIRLKLFSRTMKQLTRLVTFLTDHRGQCDLFARISDCKEIMLGYFPFDTWSQPTLARLFNCLPPSLVKLFITFCNMTWRSDGGVSLRHLVNLRVLNLNDNNMHSDVQGLLAALPPNLEPLVMTRQLCGNKDTNRFTQEQVQQLVDGLPASLTYLRLPVGSRIERGSLRYRDNLKIVLW